MILTFYSLVIIINYLIADFAWTSGNNVEDYQNTTAKKLHLISTNQKIISPDYQEISSSSCRCKVLCFSNISCEAVSIGFNSTMLNTFVCDFSSEPSPYLERMESVITFHSQEPKVANPGPPFAISGETFSNESEEGTNVGSGFNIIISDTVTSNVDILNSISNAISDMSTLEETFTSPETITAITTSPEATETKTTSPEIITTSPEATETKTTSPETTTATTSTGIYETTVEETTTSVTEKKYFVTSKVTSWDGKSFYELCQNEGGIPAIITTEDEINNGLQNWKKVHGYEDEFWVAAKVRQDGIYWTDDTKVDYKALQESGHPPNTNCIFAKQSAIGFATCSMQMAVLCERI